MNQYLAMDMETGGLDRETCSLLTAFFAVLDDKFNIVDTLSLTIKPNNNGPYCVNAQALSVNKINLIEHDKIAVSQSECGRLLRDFLKKNSDDGKIKLLPFGHNVTFDVLWVHEHLLNRNEFEKYASYRKLDTGIIGQYLRDKGIIPTTISGSLGSLANFFKIPFQDAHTAPADVMMTINVYKEMLKV